MEKEKQLRQEMEELRVKVQGKKISLWKFWQDKKDRELLNNLNKIVDINNILKGIEIQKSKWKKNSN